MSILPLLALAALIAGGPQAAPGPSAAQDQGAPRIVRVRPLCPVRLGGVYTLGLGDGENGLEDSATNGAKLSADNRKWIAENCDVIALNAGNVTPEMYADFYKAQPGFTPLLIMNAGSIFEKDEHKGNIGGWKPEMTAWTLKDSQGAEIPYPIPGGHWMDFRSSEWAAHWKDRALAQVRQYRAQGVVTDGLLFANAFVGGDLGGYRTFADRTGATEDWLRKVRAAGQYMMIPSATGFDEMAGHTTLPLESRLVRPDLTGRLWDALYQSMDGAWMEGWVVPHWSGVPVSRKLWEIQLEAADRAAHLGQVFIASVAYHNDTELEYALASYLLVYRREGRLVFQPMPLLPGERGDAGFSLALLRKQVAEKSRFFNVALGPAIQERHEVDADGGRVWRRAFEFGVVYVNSNEERSRKVLLGGEMELVSGAKVSEVELGPQTGVILLYPKKK